MNIIVDKVKEGNAEMKTNAITQTVRRLAQIMKKENLKVLEINEDGLSIKLEREEMVPFVTPIIDTAKEQVINKVATAVGAKHGPSVHDIIPFAIDKSHEVRSPLVGVFYAAPAPDHAPFVAAGKRIKKGDILCIVEAMKQMNEITADIDGEIVDVCLKNGDIVEYDQVMFKIAE